MLSSELSSASAAEAFLRRSTEGRRSGNRHASSASTLRPVMAKQLLEAAAAAGVGGLAPGTCGALSLDGAPVVNVSLCGRLIAAEISPRSSAKYALLARLCDCSGTVDVQQFGEMPEGCTALPAGHVPRLTDLVAITGRAHLQSSRDDGGGTFSVVVHGTIRSLAEDGAERSSAFALYHALDAIATHLQLRAAAAALPQPVPLCVVRTDAQRAAQLQVPRAPQGLQQEKRSRGAGAAYSETYNHSNELAPAAVAARSVLKVRCADDAVLQALQASGHDCKAGVTVAEVALATALPADRIRAVLKRLMEGGRVYCTADDDHFCAS